MNSCEHRMEYHSEEVNLHDIYEGWFIGKRIIIFCNKCGFVAHDQTGSKGSLSQNYSHKKV